MWIALCTMTVRLTTLAKAFGEGAAKKPLAGSQLRDPRAKFAFGRREARAMKRRINWFLHLRSIYYLRLSRMSTHKMQCEFAQYLKKGPTVGESNTWITQKLRCGTTGSRRVLTLYHEAFLPSGNNRVRPRNANPIPAINFPLETAACTP